LSLSGVTSQQDNDKTVSVSNTIRLAVSKRDNGALVTCEATHPALRSQRKITQHALDVHYAPTVEIQHPPGVMREGDSLSLDCIISANPMPHTVLWSRLNDSLPERTEIQGTLLSIPRLSALDNGTYVCEGRNKYGRTADEYTLVVYVILIAMLIVLPTDPGAIVEAQRYLPYSIIGGILAVLVFGVITVLIVTVWCSVNQKGSYLTHEASGLDEHGEVQEAFLNGSETREGKKEYLL
ncbi:CADM4 protein, partial [Polyodon spathula]|nr:CADM4 protein [Polyodon spathula]